MSPTPFDREKLFEYLHQKDWPALLLEFRDDETFRSMQNDPVAGSFLLEQFLTELTEDPALEEDPGRLIYLEQVFDMHHEEAIAFELSEPQIRLLTERIVTVYRDEGELESAYPYADTYPEVPVCREVIDLLASWEDSKRKTEKSPPGEEEPEPATEEAPEESGPEEEELEAPPEEGTLSGGIEEPEEEDYSSAEADEAPPFEEPVVAEDFDHALFQEPEDTPLREEAPPSQTNFDATRPLFELQDQYVFYTAVQEIFSGFPVFPAVALSVVIDYELIRFGLDRREQDFFFEAGVHCVVADPSSYHPIHFFDLVDLYGESDTQRRRRAMKAKIIELAGHRLVEIENDAGAGSRAEFVRLLREKVNE